MARETFIIPPHGGYQKLKSYQMAEIAFDATVKFCGRFMDKRSRTVDQMGQRLNGGKESAGARLEERQVLGGITERMYKARKESGKR